MIKLYSKVKIKKNGFTGTIVEFDDNNGQDLPVYLVELDPQFYTNPDDALDWFDENEIDIIHLNFHFCLSCLSGLRYGVHGATSTGNRGGNDAKCI